MGRYRTSEVVRWPPEVRAAAKVVMDWATENTEVSVTQNLLNGALALINGNYKKDAVTEGLEKPDGRTTKYGVRMAAVHPETGEYLAFYPWQHDISGMEAVWRFVSEYGWQLYEGMEAMPLELSLADLMERTNTARVAMSRRADGIAVIRVKFQWQRKRERRNLRRGAAEDDVVVSWETVNSQLNVWIGPSEEARAMEKNEAAVRHPLSGLDQA